MIKLRKNPVEGSSVCLNLSFKDAFGNYYVPDSLNWSLLALNSDEESWTVVDGVWEKELEPASAVTIVAPPASLIEGTTLRRKVVVKWTSTVGGTYTDFVDEAEFEVQPKPYVPDAPAPAPTEKWVKVMSTSVVGGSLAATPVLPIFKLRVNVPVLTASAAAEIADEDGNVAACALELDSSKTELTVTAGMETRSSKKAVLTLSGLFAEIGGYGMKEDYVLEFKTTSVKPIKPIVSQTITTNGHYEIKASDDYSSMRKVKLDVNVPNNIALYAYVGESTAKQFWANKEIEESGAYKILPQGGDFLNSEVAVDDEGKITFLYEGNMETLARDAVSDITR